MLEYKVIKRKDGRYVPIKIRNLANGSITYEIKCNCVTGRFGGWNYRTVIDHHKGYAHKSSAYRSLKRDF